MEDFGFLLCIFIQQTTAAVSCSPVPRAGLGLGLTGKLARVWRGAWYGAWVFGLVRLDFGAGGCLDGDVEEVFGLVSSRGPIFLMLLPAMVVLKQLMFHQC